MATAKAPMSGPRNPDLMNLAPSSPGPNAAVFSKRAFGNQLSEIQQLQDFFDGAFLADAATWAAGTVKDQMLLFDLNRQR